jgi:hypothetical protein
MKCQHCWKTEGQHYANGDCFHVAPTTKFSPVEPSALNGKTFYGHTQRLADLRTLARAEKVIFGKVGQHTQTLINEALAAAQSALAIDDAKERA